MTIKTSKLCVYVPMDLAKELESITQLLRRDKVLSNLLLRPPVSTIVKIKEKNKYRANLMLLLEEESIEQLKNLVEESRFDRNDIISAYLKDYLDIERKVNNLITK